MNAPIKKTNSPSPLYAGQYSREQVDLLKTTICKGASDDQMTVFLHICKHTGLDPFAKQIYLVPRWDNKEKKEIWTPQTSIDGQRLVAERTGRYCPGKESTFTYDKNGQLLSATAYVKKQTADGTWHEVSATAYWSEYVQKTKDGQPTHMWKDKPHIMLSKCFTPDTEILTENGFERFDRLASRVLQVNGEKLEPVDTRPFKQFYNGEMISCHSDMVNFMVTPNHDMITTVGKVEAGAMYATSHSRGPWSIVMSTSNLETHFCQDYTLAGYILADGWYDGAGFFNIAVSRQYKINALRELKPAGERIVHSKGAVAETHQRNVVTNFDKRLFRFPIERIAHILDKNKRLVNVAALSPQQSRTLIDAWQFFDGHTNKKTGVKRIYTSNPQHAGWIEVLAVKAGYSISARKERLSDISTSINYSFTLSNLKEGVVFKNGSPSSLIKEKNPFDEVWCVTVPSGIIIVRRNGFSMVCGNCAESLCLRKCFPNELSGVYTSEEMGADAHGAASESAPSILNSNGKFDAGQTMRITTLLEGADDYREKLLAFYGVNSIDELPSIDYAKILRSAQKYIESTAMPVEVQGEES